jgi:hypothetical protein
MKANTSKGKDDTTNKTQVYKVISYSSWVVLKQLHNSLNCSITEQGSGKILVDLKGVPLTPNCLNT